MFGISLSEIILICAVALVVIGPKQLPQIATRVGIIIYSIRNYVANLKQEIYYNSGANELINTKNELIKTYSTIRSNVMPYNKIEDYDQPDLAQDLYQPELEFERQPELFDEPAASRSRRNE